MLYILWTLNDRSLAGLFLLLTLLSLMLVRWRFRGLNATLLIDQFLIIAVSTVWHAGSYALTLSLFEATLSANPIFIIPTVLFVAVSDTDSTLILLLLQSAFLGITLLKWQKQHIQDQKQIDDERRRYYETEQLKQELLTANAQAVKMAELEERSRIAREIHDNAGHEVVAAYMSLQTAQHLLDTDPVEAEGLFRDGMKRLESGIDKIRATVHNLAPLTESGLDALRKLCERHTSSPVTFTVYGDPERVSAHLWILLESCLKEALTNVMRHSEAKHVDVELNITNHLVRLSAKNDGVRASFNPDGLGLRNLRMRARALGGNVSTDLTDRFSLICVLPYIKKGLYDKHPDSR